MTFPSTSSVGVLLGIATRVMAVAGWRFNRGTIFD
jgi:hypothetical protein